MGVTIVTGGAGMLGQHLARKLCDRGDDVVVVDNLSRGRREWVDPRARFVLADLRDRDWTSAYVETTEECETRLANLDVDYVFHLAAMIGGVGRMIEEAFWSGQNAAIDWNLFEAAQRWGAGVTFMGTACEQPLSIQTAAHRGRCFMRESDIFGHGGADPESLYGWAKVMGHKLAEAYHRQFGLPVAVCVAYNMFGPGELASIEHAHVIPALIQKCLAPGEALEVWGDGTAERCFTYVEDAAEGIILASERIEDADAVNIGSEEVVSVGRLAGMVRDLIDPTRPIRYDLTRPTGVMARGADLSYVRERIEWEPKTRLADGLAKTVEWIKRELMASRSA